MALALAFTGDGPEGWPDRRVVESVAGVATLVQLTGGQAIRQDLVPVGWPRSAGTRLPDHSYRQPAPVR